MTTDLDAIKARLAAATPGPWSEYAESGEWWINQNDGDGANPSPVEGGWVCDSRQMSPEDVEFVTHAPTDIAFLLAAQARAEGVEADAAAVCKAAQNVAEFLFDFRHSTFPMTIEQRQIFYDAATEAQLQLDSALHDQDVARPAGTGEGES